MKSFSQKYFPLLILSLFLFPQIEKGIHDFSHRNDYHCSDKSTIHLHKEEHNCAICDFIIPVSNIPSEHRSEIVLSANSIYYSEFIESAELSNNDYRLSPRAPPSATIL